MKLFGVKIDKNTLQGVGSLKKSIDQHLMKELKNYA